ncbi:CitMHS family transporter [Brevibacillus daliensis]|uniref:CitMHS family transporter n=1 Tax=Brevibacillus daliensis TaxID=2892995 RepID=UPI001E3DE2FA|nr:citrate:proton symporter [Brevibacillus daliensis]
MLAILGLLTIVVFLYLIMTKKVSVIIALVLVPVVFALIGGQGEGIGTAMLEGIIQVAPTGIMLMFAVLYFGLMSDVGLFDPVIKKVVTAVKGDPLKVIVGTAAVTMLVHLDGDGTATFMITITAFLPIYKRLGINKLILPCIVALGAGAMHLVPWSGPQARAMSALQTDASQLFTPIIPSMIAGIIYVLCVAFFIGLKERKRLGVIDFHYNLEEELTEDQRTMRRPKLIWFNAVLTILLIAALVLHMLPHPVLFIIGFSIALLVNYPKLKDQTARINSHAKSIVLVTSMIFAAGIFSGVLNGTGMIGAMADSLVSIVPESMARFLPVTVAVLSMPLSLVFTPDAFYYGMLPVLSNATAGFGMDPIEIGRAAIFGQMTTGFPLSPLTASTFLLVGLAEVDLAEHQKFTFKWAWGTTIVFTIIALITGTISI